MNTIQIEAKLDRIERLLVQNKTVLTFDETVEYTGLSKSFLYKLTSTNRIPFSKPMKRIFFNKEKLNKWLLQNEQKSTLEMEEEASSYLRSSRK